MKNVSFPIALCLAFAVAAFATETGRSQILRPLDVVPMATPMVPVVPRSADIVPMNTISPVLMERLESGGEWETISHNPRAPITQVVECRDDFMPTWTMGGCQWIADETNCTQSGMFWYYENFKNVYANCGWDNEAGSCSYAAGGACSVTFYVPEEPWVDPLAGAAGSVSGGSNEDADAPAPAGALFEDAAIVVHLGKMNVSKPEHGLAKLEKEAKADWDALNYYLS